MRRIFVSVLVAAGSVFSPAGHSNAVVPPPVVFYPNDQMLTRWVDSAVSSDGTIGYTALNSASSYNDQASKTSNGGKTFTTLADSPEGVWSAIDTDSTGQYVWAVLAVSGTETQLIYSGDYGATWATIFSNTTAPSQMYTDVAVSGDGQTIIMSGAGTDPLLSTDGGANFDETNSVGSDLSRVDISSDGTTIAGVNGAWIYLYDFGSNTWTGHSVSSASVLSSINISADGSKMFTVSQYGSDADGWLSTDSGATFTGMGFTSEFASAGQGEYSAMSDDGSTILAAYYGGPLHMSRDGGQTWAVPQDLASSWMSFSVASDGMSGFTTVESDIGFWFGPPQQPLIYYIDKESASQGESVTLRVTGSLFFDGCVASLGNIDVETRFVNTRRLTVKVPVDLAPGVYDLRVNCLGSISTLRNAFTVVSTAITPDTLVVTGNRSAEASRLAFVLLAFGAVLALWVARARRAS